MGFREVLLLGFALLLLLAGEISCATASQDQLDIESVNDTLSRVSEPRSSPLLVSGPPQANHTNQTETEPQPEPEPEPRSHRFQFPVGYRLRVYQLRENQPSGLTEADGGQQGSEEEEEEEEASGVSSDQLELGESAQARSFVPLPFQGPDLNPPVEPRSKALVKSEGRVAVPADSVAVSCGEGEVTVAANQDFLGNGQLIRSSDLTLGDCPALHTTDHILHFRTEPHGCGSTLTMTNETLVYSFALRYHPTPIGSTFILKTSPADVLVQCHYPRRHAVDSDALSPTWSTFHSQSLAEQPLHFSLRLMTEDWQSQRQSSVFFLNDLMHIEASVQQGHHTRLRVFVDHCVATTSPDPASQPSYPIIDNHGCLNDAKLTGASSYFKQRSQEDKLHFQLKAFVFPQDHRHSLYITCHLKATTIDLPLDRQHKACSFLTEAQRWVASGGDNELCGCCESSCRERRGRRSPAVHTADLQQWEFPATLGPILVEDNVLREDLSELFLPQAQEATKAASYSWIALLGGGGCAVLAVLLIAGALTCRRLRKATGHHVCS